jgi:hypothetical protein
MTIEFGFSGAIAKLNKIRSNAKTINSIVEKEAEEIKDDAKKIATSRGLKVTGAGVEGIITKHELYESTVGWAGRPNLHLYFHEVGFHAGFSKATSRERHGKRARRYKKGTRKYVAPKPHIRPATLQHKDSFAKKVKDKLLNK